MYVQSVRTAAIIYAVNSMLLYTLASIIGFHTSMTLCYIQVGCYVYYAHIQYRYVVEYLLQINVTFSGHIPFTNGTFSVFLIIYIPTLGSKGMTFHSLPKTDILIFKKLLVTFALKHALCFIIPKGIFNAVGVFCV